MFSTQDLRRLSLAVVLSLFLTVIPQVAMAANPQASLDVELLKKAITALKNEEDTFAALALLETAGEPDVVALHYSQLLRELYFKEKDVPLMVMCGRAGIQYTLSQASQIADGDPAAAEKLRGIAKTIAYNLSVNCWPGWGDEGITVTATDLAAGYDAALLNLRLGRELNRNAEAMGNAHWAVGAHHLAAGRHAEAIAEFNKSAAEFVKADKKDFELMSEGYTALTTRQTRKKNTPPP
mgnify:CR=1 FL=1